MADHVKTNAPNTLTLNTAADNSEDIEKLINYKEDVAQTFKTIHTESIIYQNNINPTHPSEAKINPANSLMADHFRTNTPNKLTLTTDDADNSERRAMN